MTKELELAKKLMILGWIYRNHFITETEYSRIKNRIMQDYDVFSFVTV